MNSLFENIPIAAIIAAICIMMIYPYIGGGVLLAAVCISAGRYWLAALSFSICIALHFTMNKHIKPVRGVVAPAKAGRRKEKKKKKKKNTESGYRKGIDREDGSDVNRESIHGD